FSAHFALDSYGTYLLEAWAIAGGPASRVSDGSLYLAAPTASTSLSVDDGAGTIAAASAPSSTTGLSCLSYQVVSPTGVERWYATEAGDDGRYCATIDVSGLGGAPGAYSVRAWMYDSLGILSAFDVQYARVGEP